MTELANCHFSLSLMESSAGAKVRIVQGTHSLLNTGHEAVQLEFNLSGTDVNAKGTCAGPWARHWKREGGKPERFGARNQSTNIGRDALDSMFRCEPSTYRWLRYR